MRSLTLVLFPTNSKGCKGGCIHKGEQKTLFVDQIVQQSDLLGCGRSRRAQEMLRVSTDDLRPGHLLLYGKNVHVK